MARPLPRGEPVPTRRGAQLAQRLILLDTDIGSDIDDAVCLDYLLRQPTCSLLGVTTVSGQPQVRAALAYAVCRARGRADVPVHAGTEAALLGPTPQPEVPQAVVLDEVRDFPPNAAIDFMRDEILTRPGEVTLLAIGPLTNVALLFATYPDVVRHLGGLALMAGVFSNRTPGAGPVEWNVHCDPHAAGIVYRTAVTPHRSIGTDVTMRCVMPTADAIERFTNPVVAAAAEVWGAGSERMVFHDPLAAVALFEPDVCTWVGGRVSVELASRRFRGATSFDPDREECPHEVAVDVDPDSFFEAYFSP